VSFVVLFAFEKRKTLIMIYSLIVIFQNKFRWLNVDYIPFEEVRVHFNLFGALVKSKKRLNIRHLIYVVFVSSTFGALSFGVPFKLFVVLFAIQQNKG
jgi:hypothetical protein